MATVCNQAQSLPWQYAREKSSDVAADILLRFII
jgi:hypothetical protein